MNVKELRKSLAKMPDDLPVLWENEGCGLDSVEIAVIDGKADDVDNGDDEETVFTPFVLLTSADSRRGQRASNKARENK